MSGDMIAVMVILYVCVGFLALIPAFEAGFTGKACIATAFLWPLALALVLFAGAKEIYESVL